MRKIYSELIDREKELNKLELHLLKVINGEGSIVNVIGEPGIGKSRLIAELKQKDAIKRVTLFEGRALPIGKNISFHPIIDILKRWAGIRKDDPEAESIQKLERAIRSVHPEEVFEIFPFVATLMGMKLTGKHAERVKGIEGEALEKLILSSLRELMMKVPQLNPTVYVLEDLHWSDLTTIEFLESLFRLAADHRILFIIDSVNIPETIQDVLMTRIDKLNEETKDPLKVASVIGRTFFCRILAKVAKPTADIDTKLEYLKEVQLIRERKRMEETEYLFKHGPTQEATYESILLRKRKEPHLEVARAIESVFADRLHNFYGILAYHYSSGENLDEAEKYLIKGGEEALKFSASSEALNYYREALKLYLLKYGDAADPNKLAMLEKTLLSPSLIKANMQML